MAKLSIVDNGTGVKLAVSGDITINKDGSYEVGTKGGNITLSNFEYNQPHSWSCPCGVFLDGLTETIYGYFIGKKFILLNPLARKVEVDIDGVKTTITVKRYEVMIGSNGSVVKITDVESGCTRCLYPGTFGPITQPTVTITCTKGTDGQNNYLIAVYNPDGLPTRVILYDSMGGFLYWHDFNFSGQVYFLYGNGNTNLVSKGTFVTPNGEYPIRIPVCQDGKGDGGRQ